MLADLLAQLAARLGVPDGDIVTGDEVRNWPDGKLPELVAERILQEIDPGTTVVCDQCDERCSIEPQRRTDPRTGKVVGVHLCLREEGGGRIEIDLNRLRRWKISESRLKELGLLTKKIKRIRRKSSQLSPREQQVYRMIHVEGKSQAQAAYERQCSPQNISKLLKSAEMKMELAKSRSVNLSKARKLPEDKRGQVDITTEGDDA